LSVLVETETTLSTEVIDSDDVNTSTHFESDTSASQPSVYQQSFSEVTCPKAETHRRAESIVASSSTVRAGSSSASTAQTHLYRSSAAVSSKSYQSKANEVFSSFVELTENGDASADLYCICRMPYDETKLVFCKSVAFCQQHRGFVC
jgi:hypothetical protein